MRELRGALTLITLLTLAGCLSDATEERAGGAPDAGAPATDAQVDSDLAAADQGTDPRADQGSADAGQGDDVGAEADSAADGGDEPVDLGPPCVEDDECPRGICEGGRCVPPECGADGDCGSMLLTCREGRCRDGCLGPGTCFRGGVCIDGACMPPQCEQDVDCDNDDQICDAGLCVDITRCEDDAGCGPDERCTAGICEPLPACGGDRGCAPNEICDDGLCRERDGCAERGDCADDEDCIAGRCVPFVCRGDAGCPEGEICSDGVCTAPVVIDVGRVLILTRPHTLLPGQQLQLVAMALDSAGDVVVTPGFTWESSTPGTVAIGEATGLAVAGDAAGIAEVRAGVESPDEGWVWSDPVRLQVIVEPEPVGLRVRVTASASGAPLADAAVRLGEEVVITGVDGVASLQGVPDGGPLSVFHAGYDYVTIVGSTLLDVQVPLDRRSNPDRAAGFTGRIDFDRVTTEGGVDVGLAGASLAGGLTRLRLATLIGDIFQSRVEAFGFGVDVPLPGGVTLAADVPIIGPTEVKDTYYVTAEPGFNLAWGFAGRVDVAELMGMFRGGGMDVGQALTTLLPYFERFEHGLRSAPDVAALPLVEDVDDVDGDGDTEERVPDYDRFPARNLKPDHTPTLRLGVDVPALPEGLGDGTDAALLFAGVDLDSVGFVPLGVSSATQAERVPMKMAPPYGGLEVGRYVVLAMSTRFSTVLPDALSVLIARFADLPPEVQFEQGFLQLPGAGRWDPVTREVAAAPVDGASLHRASFRGPSGGWTVWFTPDAAPALLLPFPPQGFGDLAANADVQVEAVRLGAGVEFEALLGAGGPGDLGDVDQHAVAFSRTPL